jgi:hypothetical protein
MRKTIATVKELVLASSAILIVVVALLFCGWTEQHYTKEATVIEVNKYNDVVCFIDDRGFEWEAEATNVKEGQRVLLLMNNNQTDRDIFDDQVVGVKILD